MAATEEGKARTAAKRVGVLLACTLAVAYAVRSAKPIAATSGRALKIALGKPLVDLRVW